MKSNWISFTVVAVTAFVLGAGFVFLQTKGQTERIAPPAFIPAPPLLSPPPPVALPAIMQPPILEGVPPMPEMAHAPVNIPPVAGVQVGGAFSLTDHKGNAVTEKSWPGKYKLVFFGFTHCPDTCPTTLQKLSAVMENYDPKGEKLAPLFITVDPERDTQAALAAYVGKFNPNILALTGTAEQVKAAEDAYKVFAAKMPPTGADYGVEHSGYVYLMSPDDKLLEVLGSDETAESMIAKIKLHF